jgi:hypothetical protein
LRLLVYVSYAPLPKLSEQRLSMCFHGALR